MTIKVDVKSLNETILNDVSIDELESRLQAENLDVTAEMWTCRCVSNCGILYCPPILGP